MIDDDGSHSFSADAVTTLMDGQGGNDTIDGRGVNGITLLGGVGNDTLKMVTSSAAATATTSSTATAVPGSTTARPAMTLFITTTMTQQVNSVADGGSGSDLIFGEAQGDNHFIGGDNDDPLDEGDLIISADGNDFLEGGNGNDILFDYLGAGCPLWRCGGRLPLRECLGGVCGAIRLVHRHARDRHHRRCSI